MHNGLSMPFCCGLRQNGLHVDLDGEQAGEQEVAGAAEVLDLALERENLFGHRRCDGFKPPNQIVQWLQKLNSLEYASTNFLERCTRSHALKCRHVLSQQ